MTVPARRLRVTPNPGFSRRIRVLYLIDSLGPGGAERLMVDLLPRLEEHGVDPVVCAIQVRHGNPVADDLRAAGIEVHTIGIERLRESGALRRVTAAIEATRPALVHTQLEFANILGSIAARRLGVSSLATIHTLDRPRRFSRDAARFRVMAWTLRHRAERVIAVSESARLHVLERAGLTKRNTTTIHNGIDLRGYTTDLSEDGAALRRALNIDAAAPVITTVAVLRAPKGIDDMLDALGPLRQKFPGIIYLIAGDGPHRPILEQRVADLGLEDAVRFAGHRDDVPAVLAATDVFALPSHTEALPTVVIEAMASGVPVVATEVGGVPEMIDPGVTGILVPPGAPSRLADAVGRLLAAPRQAEAMGIAARRVALDRFGIDRHAARLADEYRVILARREERP